MASVAQALARLLARLSYVEDAVRAFAAGNVSGRCETPSTSIRGSMRMELRGGSRRVMVLPQMPEWTRQAEVVGMAGSASVSSEASQTTRRVTMIRALTILAAVVALAVSAAPVASAGPSTAKAPRPGVESFTIDMGTVERLNRFKGKPKQGNGSSAGWDLKANAKD
jgi:hypothetical protein